MHAFRCLWTYPVAAARRQLWTHTSSNESSIPVAACFALRCLETLPVAEHSVLRSDLAENAGGYAGGDSVRWDILGDDAA